MTAARPRKKKGLKIWSPRTLALVGVFLVSMGIGTVGISASRDSQFALALKPASCEPGTQPADLQCNDQYDYTCPFGTPKEKCPKKQKPGGLEMKCGQPAPGSKTISGTCKCLLSCKGNADEATDKNDPGKEKQKEEEKGKGDGKMPELPKMPEPKDSPPGGGQPPPGTCKEGVVGGVDEKGQPCPQKDTRVACLLDPTAEGCIGADTPTKEDKTPPTTTPEPEPTRKPASWIAIVRTLAKGASDAAATTVNTVTNTVQEIGKSFSGNTTYGVGTTDVVKYVDSTGVQAVPPVSIEGTQKQISAEVTGFGAQSSAGATTNSGESTQVNPGFWGWAAGQLQNFLNRF